MTMNGSVVQESMNVQEEEDSDAYRQLQEMDTGQTAEPATDQGTDLVVDGARLHHSHHGSTRRQRRLSLDGQSVSAAASSAHEVRERQEPVHTRSKADLLRKRRTTRGANWIWTTTHIKSFVGAIFCVYCGQQASVSQDTGSIVYSPRQGGALVFRRRSDELKTIITHANDILMCMEPSARPFTQEKLKTYRMLKLCLLTVACALAQAYPSADAWPTTWAETQIHCVHFNAKIYETIQACHTMKSQLLNVAAKLADIEQHPTTHFKQTGRNQQHLAPSSSHNPEGSQHPQEMDSHVHDLRVQVPRTGRLAANTASPADTRQQGQQEHHLSQRAADARNGAQTTRHFVQDLILKHMPSGPLTAAVKAQVLEKVRFALQCTHPNLTVLAEPESIAAVIAADDLQVEASQSPRHLAQ
eukprot:m.80888 g.80888  ORF g.80888 m.80888 type:complete len:414 (+) comp12618_c0_seq2:4633-5874(+)